MTLYDVMGIPHNTRVILPPSVLQQLVEVRVQSAAETDLGEERKEEGTNEANNSAERRDFFLAFVHLF